MVTTTVRNFRHYPGLRVAAAYSPLRDGTPLGRYCRVEEGALVTRGSLLDLNFVPTSNDAFKVTEITSAGGLPRAQLLQPADRSPARTQEPFTTRVATSAASAIGGREC